MEYYFNELSPTVFQRLINGILVARFGADIRLTPLRGADGGRDGETAPGNPLYEFSLDAPPPRPLEAVLPPQPGRYLFQVKHHFTGAGGISDARHAVVKDFSAELAANVLSRKGIERVNYFILITNVPSSRESIAAVDRIRKRYIRRKSLYADVWWKERVDAELDQLPSLWAAFPEMFAGRRVPVLADIATPSPKDPIPRGIRAALQRQFQRDSNVKFRQIELERNLAKLFVDLDISLGQLTNEEVASLRLSGRPVITANFHYESGGVESNPHLLRSALAVLLNEGDPITNRIILEGGPGQGKSTITQMVAQIYREQLLGLLPMDPEKRWVPPIHSRLPFRIELRHLGDWLAKHSGSSVEAYLAHTLTRDSGGSTISVDAVQEVVANTPVFLIFDGLDEVGSDDLRDTVLDEITACIGRFVAGLRADVRAVVTTRPPAIAGRGARLVDFRRFPISSMKPDRINSYVERWLSVQVADSDDRERVRASFQTRRDEAHVAALAKNPMQLSVLLHFIRLKGEAFPDRRAELYRDYFQIVIDRDVEKSAELRSKRDMIESLHQFLGYKIHALTEAELADGTLTRQQLLSLVSAWLLDQGHDGRIAASIFKLGEERLGLVVTLRGEGEETRYGYEIQPIREYFAAAFINYEILGDAHDIFQELARRPFWREVALFLAGLRRRNEKADLIARAKKLDEDAELGWRQDGRSITSQLVLEGVLSHPPHVLSEAVDYLVELLDPEKVPVQPEQEEIRGHLPRLIQRVGVDRYKSELTQLINKNNRCRGEISTQELISELRNLFTKDELLSFALGYQCDSLRAVAHTRILSASSLGLDLNKITSTTGFWEEVPATQAGEPLWKAAIENASVVSIALPTKVHEHLVEQYAFAWLTYRSPGRDIPAYDLPPNAWAAWFLLESTLILNWFAYPRPDISNEAREHIYANLDREISPSTEGLPTDLAETVLAVLSMLRELAKFVVHPKREVSKGLREFLPATIDLLRRPRLSGWVAYRSTVFAFRALVREWPGRVESDERESNKLSRFLTSNDKIQEVWDCMLELSGRSGAQTLRRIRSSMVFYDALPLQVRMDDGRLVSVAQSALEFHLTGAPYPVGWLQRVGVPRDQVLQMLERYPHRRAEILFALPKLRASWRWGDEPRVSASTRDDILALIRDSDDPKLLASALDLLTDTAFESAAGIDELERIVRIAASESDGGRRIFQAYRLSRVRGAQRQSELLLELASRIVRHPDGLRFAVVTAAASHLFANAPITFPPLVADEERLGIHCSRGDKGVQ